MRNLRKIVAVRHGDYLSSHGGLTEKGIQQAQLLGQTIKELCTPPRWG
jgi:broad specificity phosphatase PhoE